MNQRYAVRVKLTSDSGVGPYSEEFTVVARKVQVQCSHCKQFHDQFEVYRKNKKYPKGRWAKLIDAYWTGGDTEIEVLHAHRIRRY